MRYIEEYDIPQKDAKSMLFDMPKSKGEAIRLRWINPTHKSHYFFGWLIFSSYFFCRFISARQWIYIVAWIIK